VPEFRHYYATRGEHGKFLRDLLGSIPYRNIVWHDERPTAWDRWLIGRLAAVGGRVTQFSTPLGERPGLRIVTSKAIEPAVLDVLSAIGGVSDPARPCVSATTVKNDLLPFAA